MNLPRLRDAWGPAGAYARYRHKQRMRTVKIARDPSSPAGTFGVLLADSGFSCYTLEPPSDRKEHPCIPPGNYRVDMLDHPKHGKCYELRDVLGRKAVLFHSGNFAADPPGKSDSEGCILVGNAIGELFGQKALLSSRDAYRRFMDDLDGESFYLSISDARP